eukprot:TRINITY_DN5360_c0_g2_i2.p1 TRINITY_DN5360_c0_g2~~TRINITY_DN5360_c0_g2_i2.p1  ORF type:complete len:306 (+),score=36.45 TRINITY_DN5360_c0_g2_i2:108-1025(+)
MSAVDSADTVDRDSTFTNYKSVLSRQFVVSLMVECIGVMFFQILGATAQVDFGPFVNGFALAVWIYTAANISGGHLNPAVTASVFVCGFFPLTHACLYICLQILGAILGSLVTAGLVPGAYVRMGDGGPGCFDREAAISPLIDDGQLFGWEVVMTFTLISCVYACGIAKPGHGSHTPYAVGLALVACAGCGGQYTGAALNPARVLGPAAVFLCGCGVTGIYIGAQLTAAILACLVFAFASGLGPLNPYVAWRELGLAWHEAIWLWISGMPPKRLRKTERMNIQDLLLLNQKSEQVEASASDATRS